MNYISMLRETLSILNTGHYEKDGKRVELQTSPEQMRQVIVLLPDDVERICHDSSFAPSDRCSEGRCEYRCENRDSFDAAAERSRSAITGEKPVLVLNFANPVNPGGGVRRGARAQEEDLCRKSSLLLSLESNEAKRYYRFNRDLHTHLGSDAIMFSPAVEVIRDSAGALLPHTFICAVMTCAAPILRWGMQGMSEDAYEKLLYQRITGMLNCAAHLGYRRLVLGAWGCGAFANDARVVSDVFYRVLKELNYNGYGQAALYDSIDFAVLSRSTNQYNFREFARNFTQETFYRAED